MVKIKHALYTVKTSSELRKRLVWKRSVLSQRSQASIVEKMYVAARAANQNAAAGFGIICDRVWINVRACFGQTG